MSTMLTYMVEFKSYGMLQFGHKTTEKHLFIETYNISKRITRFGYLVLIIVLLSYLACIMGTVHWTGASENMALLLARSHLKLVRVYLWEEKKNNGIPDFLIFLEPSFND